MTSALAHAPLPIAVFRGSELDCVVASEAWRQLFADMPRQLVDHLAQVHRVRENSEAVLRTDDRTFRIVIQPLPADEVMATCIEHTELLEARADADRERQLKEQLVCAVSHDLRAPMSTILLWERVLRDRCDDLEVRKRALDAIHESATEQSTLVAELIDMASVMNGSVELAQERIELDSVLAPVLERQRPSACEKQIVFEADYKPPLGHVNADAERLSQVFTKVIETSVRVSPTGTTITIGARRKRDSIVITIGQPDEDATPRREPISTLELGLVVAGEIIAMHAGTFEALRSVAGNVPTFSISLPMHTRSSRS